MYTDSDGNLVNGDTTEEFTYNASTGEWTALLSVPPGTTENVTITVTAYKEPDSGGGDGQFASDKVTGITVVKEEEF